MNKKINLKIITSFLIFAIALSLIFSTLFGFLEPYIYQIYSSGSLIKVEDKYSEFGNIVSKFYNSIVEKNEKNYNELVSSNLNLSNDNLINLFNKINCAANNEIIIKEVRERFNNVYHVKILIVPIENKRYNFDKSIELETDIKLWPDSKIFKIYGYEFGEK